MKLTDFLKDKLGKASIGRLAFFVGTAWNIVASTVLLAIGKEPTIVLAFFAGIQGVVGGAKVLQSFAENKK
jgi:hypothetical protein